MSNQKSEPSRILLRTIARDLTVLELGQITGGWGLKLPQTTVSEVSCTDYGVDHGTDD